MFFWDFASQSRSVTAGGGAQEVLLAQDRHRWQDW